MSEIDIVVRLFLGMEFLSNVCVHIMGNFAFVCERTQMVLILSVKRKKWKKKIIVREPMAN